MKFSQFADATHKGRINLSIFPNGISTKSAKNFAEFTMMVGINIPKGKRIEVGNASELLLDIQQFIQSNASRILLSFGAKTTTFIGNNFLPNDRRSKISSLLKDNVYFIDTTDGELQEVITNRSDASEGGAKAVVPFFDKMNLQEKEAIHPLTFFNALTTMDAQRVRDTAHRQVAARQAVYDSIFVKGQQVAERYAEISKVNKLRGVSQKDLTAVLATIYQHPEMARHYGLLYDFNVDVTHDFLLNYFELTAGLKELALTFDDEGNFIQTAVKCGNTDAKVKDKIKVRSGKNTKGTNTRYYHGPENFGMLTTPPAAEGKIVWLTSNPDHIAQNDKIYADALWMHRQNNTAFKFEDVKHPTIDGLYMIFEGATPFGLQGPDCPWGLLGHNVLVAFEEKKSEKLFSICSRQVDYIPKVGFHIGNHFEEGWIHFGVEMAGTLNNYRSETVFHWTGDNLCLDKMEQSQVNPDQPSTETLPGRGALIGLSENNERDVIEKDGFRYVYAHNSEAEIQLVSDTAYHFLIRQVLGNGYVMPLSRVKGRENELTVTDLLNNVVDIPIAQQSWFSYPGFNFETEPINAPSILSDKDYTVGIAIKDSESASHIVYKSGSAKARRWIFPPALSVLQARYLGLFTSKWLNKLGSANFIDRAVEVALHSLETIPKPNEVGDEIKYLADVRAGKLVLMPADWFTHSYCTSFNEAKYEIDQFFNYAEIYRKVKSGKIVLQREEGSDFSLRHVGNELNLFLRAGLQLKFHLQVQESGKTNLTAAGWNMNTLLQHKIYVSDNNNWKYQKAPFQISHAVQVPPTPTYETFSGIYRPSNSADAAYYFLTFTMAGYNTMTAKSLDLITDSMRLNDDGETLLEDNVIKDARDQWQKTHPESLLFNEVPATIFNETIENVVDKGVYKNRFGIAFRFDELSESLLSAGEEMIKLDAGNQLLLQIFYDAPGHAHIIFTDGSFVSRPFAFTYTYDAVKKFIFSYRFQYPQLPWKLILNIQDENGELALIGSDTAATPYNNYKIPPQLPYEDLHYNRLGVSSHLEQVLISRPANEVYIKFIHEDHYFIYRKESSADYIPKTISFRALSRFEDFFPAKMKADLYSTSAKSIHCIIPNNQVPLTPRFEITPLLYSEKHNENFTRSMMLMFEIDRPLKTNEQFALIIGRPNNGIIELGKDSSAIGRDFTTFGRDFTAPADRSKGLPLLQFIDTNPSQTYLRKYFPDHPVKLINGYEVLVLQPFFECKRNKWIVVISLDQIKLRSELVSGGTAESYNPFIKVVAAIFNGESTPQNELSVFSLPKYINILTERKVKIEQKKIKDQKVWRIEISNFNQRKFDNSATPRSKTRFIVAVRKKADDGLNNGTFLSREVLPDGSVTEAKVYHVLQGNQANIEFKNRGTVCIYEFELFDNSVFDENKVDWLNEPTARLIYAEEFQS